MNKSLFCLSLIFLVGIVFSGPPALHARGIECCTKIEHTYEDYRIQGLKAEINLAASGVEAFVPNTSDNACIVRDPRKPLRYRNSQSLHEEFPAYRALTINANFYNLFKNPHDSSELCTSGLGYSGTQNIILSNPGTFGGYTLDALVIRGGRATLFPHADRTDLPAEVDAGVSGIMLVKAGADVSNQAPSEIEPNEVRGRTAIGLIGNSKLAVFVFHGDDTTEPKTGFRLGDMARFMIARSFTDVINLDGSGSSNLIYTGPERNQSSPPIDIYPRSGIYQYRPAPIHLAFRERKGSETNVLPDILYGVALKLSRIRYDYTEKRSVTLSGSFTGFTNSQFVVEAKSVRIQPNSALLDAQYNIRVRKD